MYVYIAMLGHGNDLQIFTCIRIGVDYPGIDYLGASPFWLPVAVLTLIPPTSWGTPAEKTASFDRGPCHVQMWIAKSKV